MSNQPTETKPENPTQPPTGEVLGERNGSVISLPSGLHPETVSLVIRFAEAMGEKLHAAEKKYGFDDGWRSDNWEDACRARMLEHLLKGDPRDVANYCAFAWHHGWSAKPSGLNFRQVAAGFQVYKIEGSSLGDVEVPLLFIQNTAISNSDTTK